MYHRDGTIDRSWIRLDRRGDGTTWAPFDSDRVSGVEVTLVNASTRMVRCGTDDLWRFSCGGFGRYENMKQRVKATALAHHE